MLKKLLLADDSLTIQKVVGIVFANLDYQLLIADNGDAALALARKEYPDLVIADIGMPGKDGFELCREIKNDPALSQVPVLLLPGAFENFDEKKAVAVGADGWLTKPFESQALIAKVEELLAAVAVVEGLASVTGSEVPDEPEAFTPEDSFATVEEEESSIDELVGFDALDFPEDEPVSFEIPEPVGVEEPIELEPPESPDADDASFTDLSAPVENIVNFAAPAPEALAASQSFELPVEEDTPLDSNDDIWDAVTFEEEDLHTETTSIGEETEELIAFETLAEEEPALVEEEPARVEEEPILLEEEAVLAEEPALESAAGTVVDGRHGEEILELSEEDIIELEDDAVIEEISAEVPGSPHDEFEFLETPVATIVDFAAPSPVEPEPEYEFEMTEVSVAEPLEDAPEIVNAFVDTAENEFEFSDEPNLDEKVEPIPSVDVEQVAVRLAQLDPATLEEVVKRVAGPIIEKLAAQMLEQVIWEVVPDLAESMIKDEIRKIKDGAA